MLAVLLMLSVVGLSSCLNQTQVDSMKADIRQAILDWQHNQRNPLIAGAVRLAFHDCVGGCDGCLNLENPDNAGLYNTTSRLNPIYDDKYKDQLSRADFWQLAAITALDMGIEKSAISKCGQGLNNCGEEGMPHHNVLFLYGRQDCPTSPHTDDTRAFPDAHGDRKHVMKFFRQEFNFTPKETVALLGAHTLGEARRQNSGFGNDKWVQHADRLDNMFYVDLNNASYEWYQKGNNIGNGQEPNWKYWWAHGTPERFGLMLNADMCLLKEIVVDEAGVSSCNYTSCAPSKTAPTVHKYVNNNQKWLNDFSLVYQKMIQHGNGQLLTPDP